MSKNFIKMGKSSFIHTDLFFRHKFSNWPTFDGDTGSREENKNVEKFRLFKTQIFSYYEFRFSIKF